MGSSLTELVDSFALHLRAANLSPRTVRSYCDAVNGLGAFLWDAGLNTDAREGSRGTRRLCAPCPPLRKAAGDGLRVFETPEARSFGNRDSVGGRSVSVWPDVDVRPTSQDGRLDANPPVALRSALAAQLSTSVDSNGRIRERRVSMVAPLRAMTGASKGCRGWLASYQWLCAGRRLRARNRTRLRQDARSLHRRRRPVDGSPSCCAWAAWDSFVCADAAHLPFLSGTFDLLIDRGCFHYLDAASRTMYAEEAQRLLRPGGKMLLRACLTSKGERNDMTQEVVMTTFAGWRVRLLDESVIPSDTRSMPALVVWLERPR
jgi:methyltransferase family protein